MHIRKTWLELRSKMRLSSRHGVRRKTPQSSWIFSHSGYLRMEDPEQWIKMNINSCELVQSLELELPNIVEKIGDSIWKLSKLKYLYISGHYCLHLNHLPVTSRALRHLSLQNCHIKSFPDSLGKLSNLEFLCLDLQNSNLPDNLDLLVKLRHLSLYHGKEQSDFENIAKLSNLKALDLFQCELESLPVNLNLAELKLSGSNIRSLPTSLHCLEILHDKETCKRKKCDVTLINLKHLIKMEKLLITCYSMELLPSIERLQNLQELQLKDCCSLEELPKYLGGLVKLCTLDISGTRIKSVPDSITKLENIILPKGFQQDCSSKCPGKDFNKVYVDDIVELYFSDKRYADDYKTSMETSNEGNGIELDSIRNGQNDIMTKETERGNGENKNNHHASENGRGHCQILENNMKGTKRSEISEENLQPFWSKNMTLENTAKELGVSRSTMKRKLRDLKLVWPSSRKGKQPLDAKQRKQNNKAPFENDCSQRNLVNSSNSAAHAKTVGECMGSGLHTLPNPVSSNCDVVINSIPATTMGTIRDDIIATQCDMDCHQRAQEQLDGANDITSLNTLQQNKNSSNFIVKATYKKDTIKFKFSLSCSIDQLEEEVANRLKLEASTFKIKYKDEDKERILVTCISDLEDALEFSRSNNSNFVRLIIEPKS